MAPNHNSEQTCTILTLFLEIRNAVFNEGKVKT